MIPLPPGARRSEKPPDAGAARYQGPLALAQAMSSFALADARMPDSRVTVRADVEYRDLGWSAATDSRIGDKHTGRSGRSTPRLAGTGMT
jgi:hypothetical protein